MRTKFVQESDIMDDIVELKEFTVIFKDEVTDDEFFDDFWCDGE